MKTLLAKLSRFFKHEDGPTAVEYAVMLAMILMVCFTAIRTLGESANKNWTNTSSTITEATK